MTQANPVAPSNGTEKKPVTGAHAYEFVALADIEYDPKWNARSGDWKTATGAENGSEFGDFMKSLESEGQDTAVILRANPKKGGKKYQLVAGFRRFAAVSTIAEKNGTVPGNPMWNAKNPTIKAEIREMTEAEARRYNARENAARDNLSTPDMCWAVGQISETGSTGTAIASALGLSTSYVSSLLKIYKGAKKLVTRWRQDALKIPMGQMLAIAELPAEKQDEAYKEALAKFVSKEKPEKAAKGMSWLKSAKEQAEGIGEVLGVLHVERFLDCSSLEFSESMVKAVVQLKPDATEAQVAEIVDRCRIGFNSVLQADKETDEFEKEAEAAEKRNARKGA